MVFMPPVDWHAREDMVPKVLAPLESLQCVWEMRIHLACNGREEQLVDIE